jgi:hypothetical protein
MRGLTEAFAMLLADPRLRATFRDAPESAAELIGVSADARAAFLALPPEAVERQASCLIDKRAHEIRPLIPRSAAMLGDRYATLFNEYASGAWPEGHRRHWLDAAGFTEFLKKRREVFDPAEAHRAAFHRGAGRLSFHVVRRYPTRSGTRPAVQILWRRGRKVHETAFHPAW